MLSNSNSTGGASTHSQCMLEAFVTPYGNFLSVGRVLYRVGVNYFEIVYLDADKQVRCATI